MHRRVEFLLFTAGWGANHFAALLAVYRKELGFSPSALALLFGAYALGLVPGLVLAGRLSDERGRRAVVLPASALSIVASIVLAFGGFGFGVLLGGRVLYGLAMGSIMSPGSVWIQGLTSTNTGPRRATLALSAGFGVGPLISGIIAEFAPAPLVLPYVAHALVMAIGLLGIGPVPETAPRVVSSQRSDGQRGAYRIGRREVALLAGLLPVAPWVFGLAAISLAILPGIMRPLVARPVLYAAFVIVTTLASGVLVQPLTTRLVRHGDWVGLLIGLLGILLGARAAALGAPMLVFAVAILVGAGYGVLMTAGLREVSEGVPKEGRGTAVGIYYVLTYIGFALPFAHATLARHLGDVTTLDATAAAALACLLIRGLIKVAARA